MAWRSPPARQQGETGDGRPEAIPAPKPVRSEYGWFTVPVLWAVTADVFAVAVHRQTSVHGRVAWIIAGVIVAVLAARRAVRKDPAGRRVIIVTLLLASGWITFGVLAGPRGFAQVAFLAGALVTVAAHIHRNRPGRAPDPRQTAADGESQHATAAGPEPVPPAAAPAEPAMIPAAVIPATPGNRTGGPVRSRPPPRTPMAVAGGTMYCRR